MIVEVAVNMHGEGRWGHRASADTEPLHSGTAPRDPLATAIKDSPPPAGLLKPPSAGKGDVSASPLREQGGNI